MRWTLDGRTVRASTGAVTLDDEAERVVLVHGAGMDRTAWAQQTRWLAHRGYAAVAVDLPGHGGSDGPAPTTIADTADWLASLLTGAELAPAHLVGHSMGSLVALETAARHPDLVRSLVLLGAAPEMPVHPDLLTAAAAGEPLAPALMSAWGHGVQAHTGGHPSPGLWMIGASNALFERTVGEVMGRDLEACGAYQGAAAAASSIGCPVTVVAASEDRMTPARGGRALCELCGGRWELIDGVGHMMMVEDPDAVRRAILDALRAASPPDGA